MNKKEYKTTPCGGFKHCKNRRCNPAEKDCRECIDDALETNERR